MKAEGCYSRPMIDPVALALSFSGVALVVVAYVNGQKPAWQRDMRVIIVLAVGQVVLGTAIAAGDLLAR